MLRHKLNIGQMYKTSKQITTPAIDICISMANKSIMLKITIWWHIL